MLRQMREIWSEVNSERRISLQAEVAAARARQARVNEFWNEHKAAVKGQWASRTTGRGATMVSAVPQVAAQWHPDNPGSAETVSASAQLRGQACPYRWVCPLGLGHEPWSAWPKDRIQAGAGCPACRHLVSLAHLPTLHAQYRGLSSVEEITYAAHQEVPWVCRAWAVNPFSGRWRRVEHRFTAVIRDRAIQGDGCLVCAGYVIDETTCLATWFPELADELDDPELDALKLPTSAHNKSRKNLDGSDPREDYARVPWRCQHGHRWRATILNRVQGNDCPQCSTSGISKEQVRLVAELATLMDLVLPQRTDPRLAPGTPNYASHHFTVPAQLRPKHWRYKDVEVDAVLRSKQHGLTIGVEYDGAFHHSLKRRDRVSFEEEKSCVLVEAGFVDLVVNVRIGALPELDSPHAMTVPLPERSSAHEQASAVAAAIEARFPGSVPRLETYTAHRRPRAQDSAEAYIAAVWGISRPLSPKPLRAAPKPRLLRATQPHPDSLLTPTGPPHRNPERPTEIIRDYRCQCGAPVTKVQSQVTSGNTRSCGCLQQQDRHRRRTPLSAAETQAIRNWARECNVPLGSSGRIPDHVTASWQLVRAGLLGLLGPDHVLKEERVLRWAGDAGQPLGARGRITGKLWLEYAAEALRQTGDERARFSHG